MVDGKPASSTNPSTWTTYDLACTFEAGDGIGVMLGDILACIDLDHAITENGRLTETAQAVVNMCPQNWIEVSQSGQGLHIFGAAQLGKGRRLKAPDGTGLELYSRARFIRVTGKTYQPGSLAPLDFDAILGALQSELWSAQAPNKGKH